MKLSKQDMRAIRSYFRPNDYILGYYNMTLKEFTKKFRRGIKKSKIRLIRDYVSFKTEVYPGGRFADYTHYMDYLDSLG